jgi:HAD superfamily hydrolase (TIGR01509 family)
MIKALVTDVSKVLLFAKDKNYTGGLNALHKEKLQDANYKFFDYFELNNGLLEFYISLTDKLSLYVFTSETIQDAPEIRNNLLSVFTQIFSASKLGISKKDTSSYKLLSKMINFLPEEIIYIDDSKENIRAADKAGFQTILYLDNQQTINEIERKLSV